MQEAILKLDSETSKLIGFTSDYFDSGVIWSALPYGFYISNLWPKEDCYDTAITQMLTKITDLHFLIRFTCPPKKIQFLLNKFGYRYYKDQAGSIIWINFHDKNHPTLAP